MTILGTLKKALDRIVDAVKSIRKSTRSVKDMSIADQIEIKYTEFEAWQKSYNESQKRIPREKWRVFDTMVNDLIDEYDYDYTTAVDEVKFMLKTDPIDLDEGYIDAMNKRYQISR